MGFLLEDGPGPIPAAVLVRYRKLPTQFLSSCRAPPCSEGADYPTRAFAARSEPIPQARYPTLSEKPNQGMASGCFQAPCKDKVRTTNKDIIDLTKHNEK